jgi:hypothetical protein
MTPAGYMFKKVVTRPDWLKADHIKDIYSVSGCISENFGDCIKYWQHNGYWLFNQPSDMDGILARECADRRGLRLFFYDVHELEYDETEKVWSAFAPEASLVTSVARPASARLEGFDVVSFALGAGPECSPLSCNSMAQSNPVNEHCLFATFAAAKRALEDGTFDDSEPGPFRIFAVYSVLE